MAVSALLFGALAVAVRGGGDDDGESISGPAEELPAVVGAADELLGTVPPPASIAEELGTRYGEVTVGFGELEDDLDFAAEFDRLPDAEARLLGRTLGAVQSQLSPTGVGGARTGDDRQADILFALRLGRSTIDAIDPDGTPREQALAILPFAVQDLTGFDEIADDVRRRRPRRPRGRGSTALCRTPVRRSSSARWPTRSASASRPPTTTSAASSSTPTAPPAPDRAADAGCSWLPGRRGRRPARPDGRAGGGARRATARRART